MPRSTTLRAALAATAAVALLTAAAPTGAPPAEPGPPRDCADRTLVLGAMPLEVNPLLAAASLDPGGPVRVAEHDFHLGRLAGQQVVIAMTGIGEVNAERTATAALDHFGCDISQVLFSGVAGSQYRIGDVAIPQRWTLDGGQTWIDVDRQMLRTAAELAGSDAVALTDSVPVGDAACLCPGVDAATPVTLEHQPEVFVGGEGTTSDPFGGRALPCIPGGGDVFGCTACLPGSTLQDALHFAENAPSYADPSFLADVFQPPEQTTDTYAAQDMETAAVAAVAQRYGVPFVGIRAASDGQGDPLGLPGFPFQFFVYRQLAGNNAAATTIAFLELAGPHRGGPPPLP